MIRNLFLLFCLMSISCLSCAESLYPRLGDGYPGRIETYTASSTLQKQLDSFSLKAAWFRREKPTPDRYFNPLLCPVNELPFLFYKSPVSKRGLPLVVYFGGTGERGTDLALQFRQTAVFRKVCSEKFQKTHPCHLFAPMLPVDGTIESGAPEAPTNLAELVCDAMFAAIRSLGAEAVDTNRIYVTGLSAGGSASVSMLSAWPGRFAAAVPVATTADAGMMPASKPGNYWLLYNESEFQRPGARAGLDAFKRIVAECGGEVRESTFPAMGHNAWEAAWAEDSVWNWLFSQTADGRPIETERTSSGSRPSLFARKEPARFSFTPTKAGRDSASGPDRALDGLDGTAYISSEPMGKDDSIDISFEPAFQGVILVKTGTATGEHRLSAGYAEVSSDGRMWTRVANVSKKDGICKATIRTPIRFLKIRPMSRNPEIVAIREIVLLP
ncbi:MAG: prolyl oligopeptidase family serine peptidase [Kiritimatiellia bacterium]